MRTLLIKSLLFAFFLVSFTSVRSQNPLDAYIKEGLENNLVLQQKSIGLEKAIHALKIANGMFMPSVAFIGNYTTGDGGRSIALPVGDLLNPVYTTLNQLTASDNFPQIENVNQNFFPKDFYDARIRTSMPLVNVDLLYNKKIQQQQIHLQEFEVTIYKRELVRNIKVAYFNYLSAVEGERIYESALTRALEGKRVNESLIANGKGLTAYLLRSQSEIENITAQKNEATQQKANALLYFNFLLNREEQGSIDTNLLLSEAINSIPLLLTEISNAQGREELLQLQTAIELNSTALKMKQAFWVPKLSGFVDLGAQAENLQYNSNANYYLLGLQVDVPLFAGFTNRHKISQAKLDVKNAELNRTAINRQLNMGSSIARNALSVAYQNYQSSLKQAEAAQSYQRLIEKGYKEGVNTFIESVDARNQLTSAHLLVTLNQYKVLIAEANLERETATYTLK